MANLRIKQKLVGTLLGRISVRGRQLWELWQAVRSNPERGSAICQELCAKRLLPGLCRSSTVFIDVGAHIGSVIADVLRHHHTVQVIAIEADPEKAADLARRFPNVEVHSCAAGETDGEATFFVDNIRPGFSSLSSNGGVSQDCREILVRMRRLDEIISATSNVEVIKIDVEGAELGILRGASELISRCRPIVEFESGLQLGQAMGFTIEALFDWFAERKYELFVPNRVAHDGPPLQREGFVECHYYPFRTLNYFAAPAERRAEFRDRARKALGVIATA